MSEKITLLKIYPVQAFFYMLLFPQTLSVVSKPLCSSMTCLDKCAVFMLPDLRFCWHFHELSHAAVNTHTNCNGKENNYDVIITDSLSQSASCNISIPQPSNIAFKTPVHHNFIGCHLSCIFASYEKSGLKFRAYIFTIHSM